MNTIYILGQRWHLDYKNIKLLNDIQCIFWSSLQSLWREVEKYPLHSKLKREDHYSFLFVNRVGEKVSAIEEHVSIISMTFNFSFYMYQHGWQAFDFTMGKNK